MATIAMSGQFDFDRSLARCYVADMSVSNYVIAPGMYDVLGVAVMNFDGSGQIPENVTSTITADSVQALARILRQLHLIFLLQMHCHRVKPRCQVHQPSQVFHRSHRPA